jgi:hypothetical protein
MSSWHSASLSKHRDNFTSFISPRIKGRWSTTLVTKKSSTLILEVRYHADTISETDESTHLPQCRTKSAKAHGVSEKRLSECKIYNFTDDNNNYQSFT